MVSVKKPIALAVNLVLASKALSSHAGITVTVNVWVGELQVSPLVPPHLLPRPDEPCNNQLFDNRRQFSYSLLSAGARVTEGYDYHRTLYTRRPTRPYKPPTRLPMGPLGAPPTRPLGDPYIHTQRLRRHDYQRTLQHGVLHDLLDGPMGPFPTVSDDPFPSMTMSLLPEPSPPSWGSPLFGHPRDPLPISGLIT
jgi:hypothetical protein